MEWFALLRWGAVLAALWVAGLPLARRLLPDARLAAALALPAALTVVGLVAYWVGHLAFGTPALVLAVLVLAALSLAAARTEPGDADRDRRRLAEPLAVFAAAFALVVAVRAVDPAIVPWGGEKFLDFGLVRTVLRARALPPGDMWFAGRPVRYYYGGPLLAACLIRLAGVPAAVGYHLTMATWFGALAAVAYGLAAALSRRAGRSPRLGGLAATAFVSLGGTLATPARALLSFVPRDVAATYGRALTVGIRMSPDAALDAARFLAGDAHYGYWIGRYVIPNVPSVFPFWAFVNGDLRPHMASAPFVLCVAAVGFALFRAERAARRRALLAAFVPLGGLLALVNTWTLPTVCGLAALALALGPGDPAALLPRPLRARLPDGGWVVRWARRLVAAGALALAVGLGAAALAAPYLLFHTPVNRGLSALPPRSPPVGFALVWGCFLAAFAAWLAPRVAPALAQRLDGRPGRAVALVLAVLVIAVAAALANLLAAAMVLPFLAAAWWLARRDAEYDATLVVAGAGLLLVIEFAAANVWPYDPRAPRWNTAYKVIWQAWLLWGTAAGVALARVAGRFADAWRAERPQLVRAARAAPVVVAALALVASASFGAFALAAHFDDPGEQFGPSGTLDGTAYVATWRPDADAALDWLADRPGDPTLVAKPGVNMYQWRNAPSSLTGVATVAGWRHEAGYRGQAAYDDRVRDVRLIYTAADAGTRRDLLDTYGVDYVYVGPVERNAYGDGVNRTLAADPALAPAFVRGRVTVYVVEG